jgi:hypothetical protein
VSTCAAEVAIKVATSDYRGLPPPGDPSRAANLSGRKQSLRGLRDAFAKLNLALKTEIEEAEEEDAAHRAYLARCDTLSCARLAKVVPRDVIVFNIMPFVGNIFHVKMDLSCVDVPRALMLMSRKTLLNLCDSFKHGLMKYFCGTTIVESFRPLRKYNKPTLCNCVVFTLAKIAAEMQSDNAACNKKWTGYVRRFMRALEIYVSTPRGKSAMTKAKPLL